MKKNYTRFIKIVLCFFVFLHYEYISAKKDTIVEIPSLPKTVGEFISLRNKTATSPEGGAAIMLTAMMIHTKNQELGLKCLTIALSRKNLSSGNVYKGFQPAGAIMWHIKRLSKPQRAYVPFAYVVGADRNNGYKVKAPYQIKFFRNKYSTARKGLIRVMVYSYGGAYPRPVSLKKNNRGIWKVEEGSSLFLDIAPPKNTVDDDL